MKTFTNLLLLCTLLVACGCKTTGSYQTISATETAVLAANAAYLSGVVEGSIPTNGVPTVEAAFNDTQMALHAATMIAAGGTSGPVPPQALAKATAFTNAVNAASHK